MKKSKNNEVEIEIGAPLLRPGLTIRTRVSAAYAPTAVEQMMGIVREINADKADQKDD